MPGNVCRSLAAGVDDGIGGGDEDQAGGDDEDEEIGHQRGDPELAFQGGQRAVEDDGDGVLQHPEGHRAEKQQDQQADPADHLAVAQESAEHLGEGGHETRRDERDLGGEGFHQQLLGRRSGRRPPSAPRESGISESIML